MAITQGLERIFDTNAAAYDKMRSGYVAQLYADIFNYMPINSKSNVLEIGIGTGQATLPILETGCTLTAVEYGPHLAWLCQQKFGDFSSFSVITGRFEELEALNVYDMVYAATAFHWIPEEEGYTKVFKLLKPGGVFARFANHPYKSKDSTAIHKALEKIYAVYMPGSHSSLAYSEEMAKRCAEIAAKYGFMDTTYRLYHRTRTFTADEYIALLGTYSDHLAIEEETRRKFFLAVKRAIDEWGGQITIDDTIDLELARKPLSF